MTYKTRRRIWPLALMSLVAFGVFAAVVALSLGGSQPASAHDCDTITDPVERAQCITLHEQQGEDHDSNADPVATAGALADVSLRIPQQSNPIDVSVAFSDPDDDTLTYTTVSSNTSVATASISGSTMIISSGVVRGTAEITVTADDGKGGTAEVTLTVIVVEGYTLAADPAGADPNDSTIYVVKDVGTYSAKFILGVGGSQDDVTVTVTASEPDGGGITIVDSDGLIGAGFVDAEETDLEGSLTVKATDQGSRAFEIEGECETPGAKATILVEDKDLDEVARGYILCEEPPDPVAGPDRTDVSDAFTVVSYGDWEYEEVTDGFVLDISNGNMHRVNAHHDDTGLLSRDEPVMHDLYTLGVSDREMLKDMADGSPRRAMEDPDMTREKNNAYVEEGQRTVEVLAGQPNVQLTVTSRMAGPAYIRFLDSDMMPFGTDVDEEPAWRGADVVGLDSQGRLALNNQVALSKATALAYDQYNIVTPGVVPGQRAGNSYLVGAASQKDANGDYIKDYNQGAFRFFNPCPEVGHHFYVEVYEASGKYLQTTEKIVCVPSPRPGPTGLEFTIDSQEVGEGELTYRHALNADEHTVLLVDAHSRTIVASISDAPETVQFSEALGRALNDGWRYHLIVVAHGVNDQYTADAVTAEVNWINNTDAAPSTLTADAPTRSHIVCQTGNDAVMALLADCDTAPPPPADLTAPSAVMAMVDDSDPGAVNVTVTWTDGMNADQHVVFLFDSDPKLFGVNSAQTDGTTTFMNVPAGTYTAVVVAVENGPTGNAAKIEMSAFVTVTVN